MLVYVKRRSLKYLPLRGSFFVYPLYSHYKTIRRWMEDGGQYGHDPRSKKKRKIRPEEYRKQSTDDQTLEKQTEKGEENKMQTRVTRECRDVSCQTCKNDVGNRGFPRGEVKFFCQILIIFIVVVVCLYNLTANTGKDTLWTALLGTSIGYLLPNPKIKRERNLP